MKRTTSFLVAICCLLFSNVLMAQEPYFAFSPTIVGNKLRVNVMINSTIPFGLGENKITFSYPTSYLANPVIVSRNFPSAAFGTTVKTNVSATATNQKISLYTPYTGVAGSNAFPMGTSFSTTLLVLEFNITNSFLDGRLQIDYPNSFIKEDDNITTIPFHTATANLLSSTSGFTLTGLAGLIEKGILAFTNPTIINNKFRVTINTGSTMANGGFSLGSTNYRLNFPASVLSNCTIFANNFPTPDFTGGTTTGTSQVTGIASINTIYNGQPDQNQVPLTGAGTNLVVLEWDIINPGAAINLTWRLPSGTNPKTTLLDDDKVTTRPIDGGIDLTNFSSVANTRLAFTAPTVNGNRFSVKLNMRSAATVPFAVGTNNLAFNYNTAALANPVIKQTNFPTSHFASSTTTGSVPASGIFNLQSTYTGATNANALILNASWKDVATVEFDIVNPNLSTNLVWRTSGASPKTTVYDDDKTTNVPIVANASLNVTMKSVNAGADVTLNCNAPTQQVLTATNSANYRWSTGETTASISVQPSVTTTYYVSATDGSTSVDTVVVNVNCTPILNAKVFLQAVNPATGLMPTDLLTAGNFPTSDPYATAAFNTKFTHVNNSVVATTTPTVLAVTGNNAIVDWVFIELRKDISGSISAVYTKSALLQADGNVVDTDGVSPVTFPNAPSGNYYVAIRHRNHLGFRTLNTVALSSTSPALDFTNNSVPLNGITPTVALTPTVSVMNGGDGNSDGSIDSSDSAIWELQNGGFNDYNLITDYNLDASVDSIDSTIWEINNGKYEELD